MTSYPKAKPQNLWHKFACIILELHYSTGKGPEWEGGEGLSLRASSDLLCSSFAKKIP